jgi:FixJ family two-component response regulator
VARAFSRQGRRCCRPEACSTLGARARIVASQKETRRWQYSAASRNQTTLSPYTVETHRTHLMQKLNLHNTAEIVLYAVRKKIIS